MRRPKNLAALIDALRVDGCTLIQTCRHSDEEHGRAVAWSLHPYGLSVEAKHVDRLFEVEGLEPVGDGLFPEFSQQWRWIEGSEAKFDKRVTSRLTEAVHA